MQIHLKTEIKAQISTKTQTWYKKRFKNLNDAIKIWMMYIHVIKYSPKEITLSRENI